MPQTQEKPIGMVAKPTHSQDFYDSIKRKFAEERDLRLSYRPEGTAQYTSDLSGELSRYEVDPYAGEVTPRDPINDTVGVFANALHALTLLISRQMVDELENLGPDIEYYVVPPLCPLVGSPYDFSRTAEHISRAIDTTDAWLADKGLQQSEIPHELRPHDH